MTYYGKDLPNSNYNSNTKVEEGILVKGKKEAMWTKYYPDGKTYSENSNSKINTNININKDISLEETDSDY